MAGVFLRPQKAKLDGHPMFERVSDEELDKDPAAQLLTQVRGACLLCGCCGWDRRDGRGVRAVHHAPRAATVLQASEEGQKVARASGRTWRNVYRRLPSPRPLEANPEKLVARK